MRTLAEQALSGTARVGWQEVPLIGASLDGTTLAFNLRRPGGGGPPLRCTGVLQDGHLRGTCRDDAAGLPVPWGGVRR